MSTNNSNQDIMPESSSIDANECRNRERKMTNPTITEYFNDQIYEMKNKGYIDEVKIPNTLRILSMNIHGCRPENQRRLDEIKEAIQKYEIDISLFNETNTKWNSINVGRIERVMRSIDKGVLIKTADSKNWTITKKSYLPGGLLNIINSKYTPIINEKNVTVGRLGNWMAFDMRHNSKRLEIIQLYRIPVTNKKASGICSSLTQYHLSDGKAKSSNEYRKEIFREIKHHINQNKNINDIIIAGDYNQDVTSREVTKFFEEIGVKDIHKTMNVINNNETLDSTYKHGSKQIDSIAATNGIMNYIEGCRLMNYNEIVESDHRAFMIDVDIEEYFNDEFSGWDKINRVMINPARKSHRQKFQEVIEEQLEIYNIEEDLEAMKINANYHQMEVIDKTITRMMMKAVKTIEGMKRNVPFSFRKKQGWAKVIYWKMKIRQTKGIKVDIERMKKRQEEAKIQEDDEMTIIQEKEALNEARKEWEKIKEDGKILREKELLDYVRNDFKDNEEKHPKKRQKIISGINKEMMRNHTFQYLSRHVGKGKRDGLRRLHKTNQNNEIVETYVDRIEIERELVNYNKDHFTQAHTTEAYKDKIYNALSEERVRDRILKGDLQRDECDYDNIYEFLKLLKQPPRIRRNRSNEEISEEQWKKVVKQSKRRSASSIFSRRNYAVYKCALTSDRMTRVLVTYYNIILRNRYYPQRWEKILDVMLNKGKGMILGKLRTITLIEADIQYIMRIVLNDGETERIENDERFSKSNYGSRKNYAIESALLEKRLVFDNSIITCKKNIYHLTDLKSCYDRQLANIGAVIEESIGVNRNGLQLITKIIPRWKHHICTAFGISESYYGGIDQEMAGTGQGNKFSGDVCRDTSCLIIRQLEKRKFGVQMQSRITKKNELISAVAFVDDTDLLVEGDNVEMMMNEMLGTYERLYAATGGVIEFEKSKYYAWQWKWSQGLKKIKNLNVTIELNTHEINSVKCEESQKTLGVYMTPSMSWSTQFIQMVEKMKEAIHKLANTEILAATAHIFYNAYLIKKVYFGCGIMTLELSQEMILRKIYEPVILRKLQLSEKFPRNVLYMRNGALGIGLLKPKTIVDSLSLKLYVGHQRARTRISNMIQINEDNARLSYGYANSILETDRSWKPNQISWSDEIQQKLQKRNMELINRQNEPKWFTVNKTIMDYAQQYVKQNQLSDISIASMNQVRIFKKMYLPCELIGLKGDCLTKEAKVNEEKSSIVWKIEFDEVPKPSKKSFHTWKYFVEWMVTQNIITIVDFESIITTRYEISHNSQYFREIQQDGWIYYEKDDHRYNQQTYKVTCDVPEVQWKKVIAEKKPNKAFEVYGIFHVNMENSAVDYFPFNEEITRSIEQGKAVAATDASVKSDKMSGVWIISDIEKKFKISNEMYHKRWRDNTSGSAEVIVMLELITVLERRGRHINEGCITIGFDNRRHYKSIVNKIHKSNVYAMEAGSGIASIKQKIDQIKFDVKIVWNKGHEKEIGEYRQQPTKHLLRECDKRSKSVRENMHRKEQTTNIRFYGNYCIKQNNEVKLKSVNEILRIHDARESEQEYCRKKLGYKYDMIDLEARNTFKVGKVTTSMIKCVYGYNHYGQRDVMINDEMIESRCPRCDMIETWEHVVQCNETKNRRPEFVRDLMETLMKKKSNEVDEDEIISFVEDIMKFIRNNEDGDYKTNQQYIGMKELFRGYIVQVWNGVQLNSVKYHELNRIVVRKCVEYYVKCWKERNEESRNEIKQRERVIRWYKNTLDMVGTSSDAELRKYVDKHHINIEQSNTESIRKWILNIKVFKRKLEAIPKNDIRRYFQS